MEPFLDYALRDRLVFSIRSETIQRRLLTEKDPKLKSVLELALSMEAAQKDVQAIKQTDASSLPIHKTEKFANRKDSLCYHCGSPGHSSQRCGFREAKCRRCGKVGHIARVCRSKGKQQDNQTSKSSPSTSQFNKWVGVEPPSSPQPSEESREVVWQVGHKSSHPYHATVTIKERPVVMEINTGAAVSLISKDVMERLFPNAVLEKSSLVLHTYTADSIPVLGCISVDVLQKSYTGQLKLHVVPGAGPTLLGRDWLRHIQLDWRAIHTMAASNNTPAVDQLLNRYPEVFQPGLGTMRNKAHLSLCEGANPKFCRPRPIPFAIKDAVGRELDRLEAAGILRKTDHSKWAAPIVPVPKKDGTVRVCRDYKLTVNPVLHVDQYPLPSPNELMSTLAGGKHFTKLDLTSAYQQMLLDEESAKLVTLNTHQGLYMCTRLPFGVASAPAVFQREMDSILQGIPQVVCYIDDILVTGDSDQQHLQHLEEVLRRLKQNGLRLHRNKCTFFQSSVEYLGHLINAEGVHTSKAKVKAVVDAPPT